MEDYSKPNPHILIIEDDAAINDIVASYLKKKGCLCTQAYSGSEARMLLGGTKDPEIARPDKAAALFDLILSDLMLPGLSGQELIALVRQGPPIPIIVISALDTPAQKVELFELGADDYLTKPFDLDELYARILVQLRHQENVRPLSTEQHPHVVQKQETTLTHKEWLLRPEQRTLEISGAPIDLTRLEYNIMETLMSYPTKVFTKQELFEAAWHEECFVEEKAINVHISNIRSKLRSSGTDSYIQTVWGIGFKLDD